MDNNSLKPLIVLWFKEISQFATEQKSLTGAELPFEVVLSEIAAKAERCQQFVEDHMVES